MGSISYEITSVIRPLIRQNTVEAEDNFVQVFSQPKEYKFYEISEVRYIKVKKVKRPFINGWRKQVYMNINIEMDELGIIYERQVYDIMSVIGDWGGVVQVFEVLGGFIIGSW